MLKLSDREWKSFNLIDDNMFYIDDVKTFKSTAAVLDDGVLDIVGATSKNNGNVGFLPKKYKDYLIKGNCICLIKTGQGSVGDAVYKQGEFVPSNNVCVIRSSWLNKYNGLFIVTEINKQAGRYSYGYIRNNTRIRKEQLLLPITENGTPDYYFMETYIKEREAQKRNEYLDYCKEQLKIIGEGYNLIPLAYKQWKAFFIGGDNGLFEIYSGKRLTVANMTEGECPFIGATDSNNGITNWVGNRNETYDSNVLGVNYNGSVVENFYHPYHSIFSDDVKRLHLKECEDNKFVLLFFSRLILMQKAKYTYGYKFNGTRMNRQKILVPVTNSGEPDYEYMEKYSRNLLSNKIQAYIDYVAN